MIPFFLTADSALGRIDKASLSQKTVMELLIVGIVRKSLIREPHDEPKDVSEWHGVTVNDDGEVLTIDWSYMDIPGSINLRWLPSSVEEFRFINEMSSTEWLSGTLDLTHLPESLVLLDVSGNHLEGEISLTSLPDKLGHLDVDRNRLSGTLDLTKLPLTLKVLRLASNKFEGMTDFSQIPKTLKLLRIAHNSGLKGWIRVNPSVLDCHVQGTQVEMVLLK